MTVPETQTQTPVMTAAALYDALLHNTAPYILVVRNPDDFARWRIEGRAGQIGRASCRERVLFRV